MGAVTVRFTKLEQVLRDAQANQPHAWSSFEIHADGRESVFARVRTDVASPMRMESLRIELPGDLPQWVNRSALEAACVHYRREVVAAVFHVGGSSSPGDMLVGDRQNLDVVHVFHYIERAGEWLLEAQGAGESTAVDRPLFGTGSSDNTT